MSLVYTTLLSLVPLLAISFSILKGFGVHNQIEPFLLSALEPLGERRGEVVSRIVGFVDNVQVGVLGSVGFVLLFYTVVSLMQKIEHAFNDVWQVTAKRTLERAVQGLPERHHRRPCSGLRGTRHLRHGDVGSADDAHRQHTAGGYPGGADGSSGSRRHGDLGVHVHLHVHSQHPGPADAGTYRSPGGRACMERSGLAVRRLRGAGQQLYGHLLRLRDSDRVHDLAVRGLADSAGRRQHRLLSSASRVPCGASAHRASERRGPGTDRPALRFRDRPPVLRRRAGGQCGDPGCEAADTRQRRRAGAGAVAPPGAGCGHRCGPAHLAARLPVGVGLGERGAGAHSPCGAGRRLPLRSGVGDDAVSAVLDRRRAVACRNVRRGLAQVLRAGGTALPAGAIREMPARAPS